MADGLFISQLRADRGGVRVLTDVTLHAPRGEVTALLGLNGSGKTTLLSAALGLIPATCARCEVDAQPLRSASPRRRAQLAAYIPQRIRVDDGLTALEAVLMGANARTPLLRGYGPAERERALSCLERLGAAALADRPMGTLSEGQRRLAVLARALLQNPRALLLDEPDSALDLPRRWEVLETVLALAREGRAALVSLHDAQLALNRCDRALILQDGRIARALDLHAAGREEIEDAMRALYGDVCLTGTPGKWGLLPGGGALHPKAHPV